AEQQTANQTPAFEKGEIASCDEAKVLETYRDSSHNPGLGSCPIVGNQYLFTRDPAQYNQSAQSFFGIVYGWSGALNTLYALAAKMIVKKFGIWHLEFGIQLQPQPKLSPTPYARRLQRPDGFIPWPLISSALLHNYHTTVRGSYDNKVPVEDLPPLLNQVVNFKTPKIKAVTTSHLAALIERTVRALSGFPGLWTKVKTPKGKKRLKIFSAHLSQEKLVLDQVQLEGLAPTPFNQIKNQLDLS
ncbi:MAG: hypothetical protein HYS86_04155, partial [Candidatus Chisholmbacteria bacterium]|nr:hypothetical protein [Candidatus Chisholmbacteria bacterium]